MAVTSACLLVWAGPARGVPWGYAAGSIYGADGGVSALAYASDGTLYVADSAGGDIVVIAPGGARSTLTISGATLVSVFGMCVSGDDSRLYVTDNKAWGDGSGDLYAVDVSTGAAATLLTGMDAIDDVAVRHTGEVFVSDAAGIGTGGVYQVDPNGGGVVATVAAGLDFAAGLAFDSAGDLLYQQAATYSFVGEVFRVGVSAGAGGLSFGTPELLATGLSAACDLAVDGEDDVFVSGSGGVYELDRDAGGSFTGSAALFDAHGFSTEMAFVAGTDPFEGGAGYDGGHLTFVPEYAAVTLTDVTTVPEPAAMLVLAGGAALALSCRRPGPWRAAVRVERSDR